MTVENTEKPEGQLETWAIVEVMGHSRYAGFARQVPMGGAAMIRIDVPEVPAYEVERERYNYEGAEPKIEKYVEKVTGAPAFTKFLGVSSIFAITPCTKEAAIAAVKAFRAAPITVIDLPPRRQLGYSDDD